MEQFLLQLLQMNAIHFISVAPPVEYHGLRQPSYGDIQTVLDRIQRDQWNVRNHITLGGRLWCGRPYAERAEAEAELVA